LSAFLFFDAVGKLMKLSAVVQGSAQAGYSADLLPKIGMVLLVCTILYLIPRTLFLGSLLLTAYLGGAVATGVRMHAAAFMIVFPIVFAVLVWVGTVLRDGRFRTLLTS